MTIETVERAFHRMPSGEPEAFDRMAEAVLAFQRAHNPVYARYCASTPAGRGWRQAPYLPVAAFKHQPLTTFPPEEAELVFQSSGTGSRVPSTHHVRHAAVYERAFSTHFERVFGAGPFTMVAHLPHYAERGGRSSLLYMVEHLIDRYGDAAGGLFLEDRSVLERACRHSEATGTPLILFGAAFGLLDLLEEGVGPLPPSARVIETGGMKTYRRAITRADLHQRLSDGFGLPVSQIWSEYGMCELLSQCYTRGGPVFFPPPWMRFRIVDPERPDRDLPEGVPGALAVFDLANLYSAAALLTEDRAVQRGQGFEVLGRLRHAALRGCNFLLESA